MATIKTKSLGKYAERQETRFWKMMRSADSGTRCFS